MTRVAALSFALVLAAGAAHAQRESNVKGITLLKACTGATTAQCDAYVDGFGDAVRAAGRDHAIACIPMAATGTELRDVLVHYLKGHPEDEHVSAGVIATRAFSKAYPCASK
jgi:hypothetical protein